MTSNPKCPACNGLGYHRCECWPGDCICGYCDEDCEECQGHGIPYDDEDDYYDCFHTAEDQIT